MSRAERLIEQAAAEVGSVPADLAPAIGRDGLEVLCDSFEAMPADPVVEVAFDAAIVRRLKAQRSMAGLPPVGSLPPVSLIVGLPRTGSTLLHNLLCAAAGAFGLSHAELLNPHLVTSGARDLAVAEARARLHLADTLSPAIRDSHPMDACWPDECTLLFENSFASYQYPITFGLPGYLGWLRAEQMSAHYAAYRKAVGILVERVGRAGELVLKGPFHVLSLAEAFDVLGEPRVLLTVRSSNEVIASWFRLVGATYAAFYGRPLPKVLERQWFQVLADMCDASRRAHRSVDAVVRYQDLAADPVGVASTLGSRPPSTGDLASAAAWLGQPEAQRRARPGEPAPEVPADLAGAFAAYDLEFGLTA